MASMKTVVYECDVCGTEVTVNSEGVGSLSPIYCCGISLIEKKTASAKKTASRKTAAKKTAPKKTAAGAGAKKAATKAAKKPAKKATAGKAKKKR
jgi:hypothetical protein